MSDDVLRWKDDTPPMVAYLRAERHVRFVPDGCSATLDDGRQIDGPAFIEGPLSVSVEQRPDGYGWSDGLGYFTDEKGYRWPAEEAIMRGIADYPPKSGNS